MKRREFLKTIGLAAAVTLSGDLRAARTRRPNILFIMTDQQFADALSCTMGSDYIRTPNIDSLAAKGMLFTKAYCANPLCVPNRTSIFTGRYPHEHGKQINSTKAIDVKEFPNIGMVLRKAGYSTGYFGKWHLPYPFKKATAEQSGYDERFDAKDYSIAAPTIEFIKKNKNKPFFVVFSLMNPHNICQYGRSQPLPDGDIGEVPAAKNCPPAPSNLEKAKNQSDSLEAIWQARLRARYKKTDKRMFAPLELWGADDWRKYRWAYYRMVELADKEIGRILLTLRKEGLEENTAIIFTSDHGDGIGSHRWAQKNMFYDECSRIPFIISQPGRTKVGKSDYLVNNGLDIMPTICDYAGAKVPAKCKGVSLRGIAEGNRAQKKRKYVACSTCFVQDLREDGGPINIEGRMIRTKDFKYYIFDQGKRPEMLIDMKNDPGEMENLAGNPDYGKVLAEHREMFVKYKKESSDGFLS
ncbi:MAG: sulfatase-like hydrolase/transferase [Planctomycetes bacterium]|nr:sulfatase-like hydrolase/transferase [Planctomycetota bacterium]